MSLQEKLHELFLLESRVRGMRSRLDSASRRRTALQTKLNQLNQQRQELADQVKLHKARAHNLEQQANEMEQRVAKLREQMTQVTNNKEYSALLVEANTVKADKGGIEEQALELLGKVDELQAQFDSVTQQVADQEKLVAQAEAEVKSHEAEVGEKLTEATAERDEAAKDIPAEILTEFNRLANAYDGEAMAEVNEENRRRMEYTCGGCYMTIPVERLNTLFTRPDEPTDCPNCNRLLFVGEDLKASISASKS